MENATLERRSPRRAFDLTRMETIFDRASGKDDHPHRHNYYTVLLVRAADGAHHIDFKSYPLGQQQVHFVAPGQIHQVQTHARPQGFAMTFTSEFLLNNQISTRFITDINLFRAVGEHPPLEVEATPFNALEKLTAEMETWQQSDDLYRDRALAALLQLFLIRCHQQCNFEPEGSENSEVCMLRDFRDLLEGNFRQWHKVHTYADQMALTPKYLGHSLKVLTGKTAKEMIQERILLEGKRLLLYTSLSVKEIAYELGFEEPLHFSSFFKRLSGTSPSKFRAPSQPQ